jgi:sugar phosphate isomerase/epimerase
MKLGCCAYSYRDLLTSGEMTYEDFLDTCAALGFDGVELTTYYLPDVSRDGLNHLKRACFRRGLGISGAAIGTDLCQPDDALRSADIAKAKEWLPRAAALGAPFLRVFGGAVREGDTEDAALARCVASLEEILPVAEAEGVIVGLENHGGVTATAAQVLGIVRAIGDNPWFGINLDTGNYRDPGMEFPKTAPHTVTVHAKSHYHDAAGAKREVDWPMLRNVLSAHAYRGFLNIEYEEPEEPRTAVPAFLAKLAAVFRAGART